MEKSPAYFVSQCRNRVERLSRERDDRLRPTITISHQTGAGAPEIAERLAMALQKPDFAGDESWCVFNHQIVEKTLEEIHWPKRVVGKITEEKRPFIEELINDVLDLQPPSWVLVPQLVETIRRLAAGGHAILVGHGATVVTAGLTNVFHVRLTGSPARRIRRVQELKNLTPEAAASFIKAEDRKREKFLKAHFRARLENELLYDLAINTDRVSSHDAVAVISEGAQRFFYGLEQVAATRIAALAN